MDCYLLRKKSDGSIAKLWYRDEIIVFMSKDEIAIYKKQFPMFFHEDMELYIEDVELEEVKCDYALYSDIIHDEEFNEERKDIQIKYSVWDKALGKVALCDNHVIAFDTFDEVIEFYKSFPKFFTTEEFGIGEEYSNRGWYLFISYKDFVKSEFYNELLEEYGQ